MISSSGALPVSSSSPTISLPWGHVMGIGAFLTIIMVIPSWAESFAMPKVIALTVLAGATLPLVWLRRGSLRASRIPLAILAGFLAFAVLAQFSAGAPWASGLWGEWSRRAGTLTTLSLAIALLAGAVLSRAEARVALTWIAAAGLPVTAYGLLQIAGLDPIAWGQPKTTDLVSTFGNTNFAAAGLSILGLISLGLALWEGFSPRPRIALAILALAEFFLALLTGSSQAIFAIVSGALVGSIALALRGQGARRLWTLMALGFASVVGLGLTCLALFGFGPLVPFISADTLTYRQWYWKAAWNMAAGHPILGVGPDGFGRFYGQFRSLEAASAPTLGTSAAHDVPLQWASTIGIPAGLLYVALMVSVGIVVSRRLWRQGASASPLVIAVFAAWGAYQVQSLVSIDATPLALLGWLSTGLLLALTRVENAAPTTPRGAWICAGILAAVGVLAWMPALLASQASASVTRGTEAADVYDAIDLVEGPLLPCEPSVRVARWMVESAPSDVTVNAVFAAAVSDNRCYGLVGASADLALQLGDVERAQSFAEQGVVIDPLNYSAWILLARARSAAMDESGAVDALERARSLAPDRGDEIDAVVKDLRLPLL